MQTVPPQQVLRAHIEAIASLTNEDWAVVLPCFTFRQFSRQQVIFREGDRVNHLYFIIAGLTKLVYTNHTGRQHIVAFALEDWWETDSQAFFAQQRATLSLHCLEATTAYCLSLENYHYLLQEVPAMQRFFLHKTARGFVAAQQRTLLLMTASARQRYEQLVQHQPALLQRVSKTALAAYLGVSRETLSRLYSSR